jgi:cytochrome c
LWNLDTLKPLQSFEGHQGAVAAVAISPDGQPIVSSSWDHTIRVWGMKD